MSYDDSAYFMGQGSVLLQRRGYNTGPVGGFENVGDADLFQIDVRQTFDDVRESQTGNRFVAAHTPTGADLSLKINLRQFSKSNLVKAYYGTDTGAVSAGSVASEIVTGYNGGLVPLANPGVSSVVLTLDGNTDAVVSIPVLTPGSGYLASSLLPLTISDTGGTGATGYAVTDAAGTVVGAYVTAGGATYTGTTAVTITTPGAGTGATFGANLGGTAMVLGTDYTLDTVYGSFTILAASTVVPPVPAVIGATNGSEGAVSVKAAYNYGAYTGKVEVFTSGIQYFTALLQGFNVNTQQPVIVQGYQLALDMAKMMGLIESKNSSMEIDGMLLQDKTKPLATTAAPYSQFLQITKG